MTATATKPKKKRARQVLIKEVEALRHPALDEMFEDREDEASKISKARTKLGEINENIKEYMEEHNLEVYEAVGYKAVFQEGETEFVITKIKEPKPEPANK